MFATDLACKFGVPGWRWGQAEVYVPDLRNKPVSYRVSFVGTDNLLGKFVQLIVQKDGKDSNESFYLGHTETKFKEWDIVHTWQRLGQMSMTWATTGWHVHFEYRTLSVGGTWASQRFFTALKEVSLDNKRKGILYNGWKWGDLVHATTYDVGDVSQNDASPYIGASGKDLRYIPNAVALTKDVRRSLWLKFGDKIKVQNVATWMVHVVQIEDEMNARYRESGPSNCIRPTNGWECIKMDIPRTFMSSGTMKLISKL